MHHKTTNVHQQRITHFLVHSSYFEFQGKKHQKYSRKMLHEHCTGLLPGVSRSTSGAIQPSVPGIPDRKEKLLRPSWIFLQRPKSEMRARTWPRGPGLDRRMFLGLRSRWTAGGNQEKTTLTLCSHLDANEHARGHGHSAALPKGRVTTWTRRQFIAGPRRETNNLSPSQTQFKASNSPRVQVFGLVQESKPVTFLL